LQWESPVALLCIGALSLPIKHEMVIVLDLPIMENLIVYIEFLVIEGRAKSQGAGVGVSSLGLRLGTRSTASSLLISV
jgi:hypothetical protein